MKVALVYDRANKWGGAERVLLLLNELFPQAPLYVSVYSKDRANWPSSFPKIITSFLQYIPFAKNNHEVFALAMPLAFESFDFSDYDLVISVTSEAAKGILTKQNTVHICYCLTPTRYLWSGYEEHFKSKLMKTVTSPFVGYLRKWDKVASGRPDVMVSISTEVSKRVKKYYDRDSVVIFPPVTLKKINNKSTLKKDYYLLVSRLVRHKKVDIAIEAFNRSGKKLVIVGSGREENKLKSMAKRNIIFTGVISDRKLAGYYSGAKALVMPQLEDYGLVSLEAQLYGVPVIAYGKGGVLDTVVEGKTGVFFYKQNADKLINAVYKFENMDFDKVIIEKNAERFSKEQFKRDFMNLVKQNV